MITKEVQAKDLQDYYDQLYKAQADAHKSDYMLVHQEIKKYLPECQSYTEFGVKQGVTLAIPLLAGIKKVRGYDVDVDLYNKAAHHFTDEAKNKQLDFVMTKANTRECVIDEVDMLYIDTWHVYEQLKIELQLHGNKVNKYIIMHDTYTNIELRTAIHEFTKANRNWQLINECNVNVGFSTLKRVS